MQKGGQFDFYIYDYQTAPSFQIWLILVHYDLTAQSGIAILIASGIGGFYGKTFRHSKQSTKKKLQCFRVNMKNQNNR
jgi:hypothetical protein